MVKKRKKSGRFGLGLNPLRFALAGGILTALCVAFTVISGMYGYFPFSNMFIADIYANFGYNLSWPNVLLGPVYSFIDGFILTGLFALVYNRLIK